MGRYECEVFGLINYSPDLSYDALYAEEERLLVELQDILDGLEAVHLDFWGSGDALQFQCALPEFDAPLLRSLCDEITALLKRKLHGKLAGRLLALDKHLSRVHIFYLYPGRWSEQGQDITTPDA